MATTDCGDSEMVCDVVRITSTGGGESVAAAAAGSTGINRLDASVLITPALLVRVSCITVAAQTKGEYFFKNVMQPKIKLPVTLINTKI